MVAGPGERSMFQSSGMRDAPPEGDGGGGAAIGAAGVGLRSQLSGITETCCIGFGGMKASEAAGR